MIRPYRAGDYDQIAEVCLRTADAGGDATGLFPSDDLMPDLFARPYVVHDPSLAWVVDDGRVSGYIVATADTRAFVDWFGSDWQPTLTHHHPLVDPARMLIPELDDYPAHLHIDLLPHAQGRGLGRELIGVLVAELERRGIRGLHLAMDPQNTGARAFYDRLGFVALTSSTAAEPLLGLRLTGVDRPV
jgi:ribosomal protein S18 acetylase RimI-like enzyme